MKEYLVKDFKNGYFSVKSTDKQDDWIEILEDAEIALFFEKNQDKLVFYKNGGQSHASIDTGFNWKHDSLWTMEELLDENHSKNGVSFKHTVVWQRKANSTLVEYLNPADWSLHVVDVDNDAAGEDWIKVPDGANAYIHVITGTGKKYFYKFGENPKNYKDGEWSEIWNKYNSANEFIKDGDIVLWQRHNQPEELPFVDDEPKTAWDKQEGGSHYKDLKIQPMQYALDNKLDYAQANVVKYVTRHANKNGKEDLLKAIHNIELMIEYYYGDKEQSQ